MWRGANGNSEGFYHGLRDYADRSGTEESGTEGNEGNEKTSSLTTNGHELMRMEIPKNITRITGII
jgi:hypothetical protein